MKTQELIAQWIWTVGGSVGLLVGLLLLSTWWQDFQAVQALHDGKNTRRPIILRSYLRRAVAIIIGSVAILAISVLVFWPTLLKRGPWWLFSAALIVLAYSMVVDGALLLWDRFRIARMPVESTK